MRVMFRSLRYSKRVASLTQCGIENALREARVELQELNCQNSISGFSWREKRARDDPEQDAARKKRESETNRERALRSNRLRAPFPAGSQARRNFMDKVIELHEAAADTLCGMFSADDDLRDLFPDGCAVPCPKYCSVGDDQWQLWFMEVVEGVSMTDSAKTKKAPK